METLERNGKTYALVPLDAWRKLASGDVRMPELPRPDANGDRPALPFMRAIIARGIIRDRVAAGLSQAELARRAGMEPATLNRIEKARVTPDQATIAKIDKALKGRARMPAGRAPIRGRSNPAGARAGAKVRKVMA